MNKDIRFRFQAASELPMVSDQLKEILDQIKKQQIAVTAMGRTYDTQTDKIVKGLDKAAEAQRKVAQGVNQTVSAVNQTTGAVDQATDAIKRGSAQQVESTDRINNSYRSLVGTLRDVRTIFGVAFSIMTIKTFTESIIDAKSKVDFFRGGLEQMLGSQEKLADLYPKLIKLATTSPFTVEDLFSTTLKLKAMGVAAEEIIPTLNAVGNAAAIVGTDKLPLIAKAYTDVKNKGRLMKQELNQFAENGIPLYDLLAESMGKPRAAVIAMAEAHTISFEHVEKALMDASAVGGRYYGMMAIQAETQAGKVSNLIDVYFLARKVLGDYYDKGIRNFISWMQKSISATIGSEKAIERTNYAIKSAATVLTGLVLAWQRATIATNLSAAASTLWSAAIAAKNYISGLYQLTLIRLAAGSYGFTTAQIAAAAATRATNTALAAAPWGAVFAVVTLATAAYYAFKAASVEVVIAEAEEVKSLRVLNKEMEIKVAVAKRLSAADGSRKLALQDLQRSYPEYFANLNIDKVSNMQLEGAMAKVNLRMRERIALAALVSKADSLTQQQVETEKQRLDVITKLRATYSNQSTSFTTDDAFMRAMEVQLSSQQRLNVGNMSKGGSIIVIDKDLANLQKLTSEYDKTQKELIDISTKAAKVRLRVSTGEVNDKILNLRRQLNAGTISHAEYNVAREKATKEHVETVASMDIEKEGKKQKAQKRTLEMSLENDVRELKAKEQTFEIKMMLLSKEEALKIEHTRRTVTDSRQEQDRILSIEREYASKRKNLVKEYYLSVHGEMMKYLKGQIKENETQKIKLKALREVEKIDFKAYYKELEKLDKDLADQREKNQQAAANLAASSGALDAAQNANFWQNKRKVVEDYYRQLDEDATNAMQRERYLLVAQSEHIKERYGENSAEFKKNQLEIEKLSERISKKNKDLTDEQIKALVERQQNSTEAIRAIMQFAEKALQEYLESTRSAIQSLDVLGGVYDDLVSHNKAAFDQILKDTSLSYEKKKQLLAQNIADEKFLMEQDDNLEIIKLQLEATTQQTVQMIATVKAGITTLVGVFLGDFTRTITGAIGLIEGLAAAWMSGMAEMDRASQIRSMKYQQLQAREIVELQRTAAVSAQLHQEGLSRLDEELAAFTKQTDARTAALLRFYEVQKQAAAEFYADKALRAQEDDVYRAELLAQGEAREVAALEAAKQRELDRAISVEERARVTNAFDALIAEVHVKYENVKGQKSAETSLAIQEIKAQEKDVVIAMDTEAKDAQNANAQSIRDKQDQMTNERLGMESAYREEVRQQNSRMFQAQLQLAIAEIRVEIVKLRAKRMGLFANKGAIDDAIAAMNDAIGQVTGMENPYGPYDNPTPRNPDNTSPGGAHDPGAPKPSPRGAGPRYQGDPWLKLNGNPAGIDTIPINAHEGERIISRVQNQRLFGLRSRPDNETLVSRYEQYERLREKYPGLFSDYGDLRMNASPLTFDLAGAREQYGAAGSTSDFTGVIDALKGVQSTIESKSTVNVSVDPYGAVVDERRFQRRINHQGLFTKSL